MLVGTISIEKSEHLSTLLKKAGIKHVVLNAKYHEREAEIVAQAGRFGAVTIATNMAGRGTDIILGGVPDHRAKAVLVELAERKLDPEHADRRGRAGGRGPGRRPRWRREFKRELQQRKPTPEERSELARRYLGLMASFAPDHPSVLAVRALAPEGSPLAALPRRRPRPAPRRPRRRSPSPSTPRSRTRSTSWPSTR